MQELLRQLLQHTFHGRDLASRPTGSYLRTRVDGVFCSPAYMQRDWNRKMVISRA